VKRGDTKETSRHEKRRTKVIKTNEKDIQKRPVDMEKKKKKKKKR